MTDHAGYVVLEVLEEDDSGWEPEPMTVEQRIARSVDGFDPLAAGHGSIFEVKAPAKGWQP